MRHKKSKRINKQVNIHQFFIGHPQEMKVIIALVMFCGLLWTMKQTKP